MVLQTEFEEPGFETKPFGEAGKNGAVGVERTGFGHAGS
jgi:hypothetical protein